MAKVLLIKICCPDEYDDVIPELCVEDMCINEDFEIVGIEEVEYD